jgi:hypothetical protein
MTHADGAWTAATGEVLAPEPPEQHRRDGFGPQRQPSDQHRPALRAEPELLALQPL